MTSKNGDDWVKRIYLKGLNSRRNKVLEDIIHDIENGECSIEDYKDTLIKLNDLLNAKQGDTSEPVRKSKKLPKGN